MHVIATAGHVDHGKSTLVRALTGMEPDRLAEERRRGMTIDLGYAWTRLPGGTQVAFVDVPGHQRFVTTMLAGVGPVPAVLFVVAADEGWSAQSTEHLDALNALDVRHGVLAVSRSDLGDAELAAEEAREYLAGSSLEGIESVAVSAVKGVGMDELRDALERMSAQLPGSISGPTRLWVDRVFTIRGSGTVITGTLSAGTIRAADELQLHPSGRLVRVRGIESLKTSVDEVSSVARVALNLRAVKPDEVHRGDALTTPGRWDDVAVLDVRVRVLVDRLPAEVSVHVGSAAIPARVRPLGADTVRLTLATALPLHIGERMILRDPGAQRVVAGAVMLDPMPPALRRRGAARERAEQLGAVSGVPSLENEVARRGAVRRLDLIAAGVSVDGPLPADIVVAAEWLINSGRWQQWCGELAEVVDDWAKAHPLQPGMPRRTASSRLGLPDAAVLDALVQASGLVLDFEGVHRRNVEASLPPEIDRALTGVLDRLRLDPFDAPEAPQLSAAGLTEKYLAVATRSGRLLRVAAGVYLHPDAPDEAVHRLAELDQPFTLSQARQALGTTRRVALPLLELLDKTRRTQRVDSQRRSVR
jgi:selenocysteine-specific elongation factor